MFTSLSSFSVFFFTVAAFLLAGILFEEKFLRLEDKFDNYIERKKREKKQQEINRYKMQKMQSNNRSAKNSSTVNFKKYAA